MLDSRSLNFTADTTSGDKPLDAELNFDVYHVENFSNILWDAGHVTTTHLTDNSSMFAHSSSLVHILFSKTKRGDKKIPFLNLKLIETFHFFATQKTFLS